MKKHGFVTVSVLHKRAELDGTVPSLSARNATQSRFVNKIKNTMPAIDSKESSPCRENQRDKDELPRSPRLPASARPTAKIPFAKR
jgi:hypothetical protein